MQNVGSSLGLVYNVGAAEIAPGSNGGATPALPSFLSLQADIGSQSDRSAVLAFPLGP